jgi:hypothetical protein
MIFIDVGMSVTGPSLRLAVVVPLNTVVMLSGRDAFAKMKLVMVWVCPAVPSSLTISTCALNGEPAKGDVVFSVAWLALEERSFNKLVFQ